MNFGIGEFFSLQSQLPETFGHVNGYLNAIVWITTLSYTKETHFLQ